MISLSSIGSMIPRARTRLRVVFLTALLVAMLALVVSASATLADTSAQQSLDALNRIRSENGIPAGITLNDDWSAKCAAHDRYMQINDVLVHDEDPSKPGYSDEGNWAGTSSVLAVGGEWGPNSTPWDTAPIHFAQMLGPGLSETGIANVGGYSCLTTWPGYERTGSSDVIYTYPGDGRSDVAASERAAERPFVPGEFVGLPAGTTTGPYLYVLPDGPWTSHWNNQPRLAAASLTGPAGQVEVRMIDNTNSDIAGYLPRGSGMVIPVTPLRSNASYVATVTLSGGGDTLSKTWSFKTLALDNTVSIDVEPQDNGSVQLSVSSDAPNPTLTLAAGERTLTIQLRRSGDNYLADLTAVTPGIYQACASSGGGDGEYQQGSNCKKVTVKIDTTPPTVSASGASDGAWLNHAATITLNAADTPGASGVASIGYTLDGVNHTVAGASTQVVLPASPNATHTLTYQATDLAGNVSADQSLSVHIDTVGPTTVAKPASGHKGKAIALKCRVSDNLSPRATSVTLTIRNSHKKVVKTLKLGTEKISAWYAVKWTPKAKGTYRYTVTAKDLAGNKQAKAGSAKITVKSVIRKAGS